MIGIYKITSPSNRVYIGQSVELETRFLKYKNNCNNQTKLKRSFNKYGFENHKFEILEECDIPELNNKERYWQDYYESVSKGLNCRATASDKKSGYLSNETKAKLSESKKGKRLGFEPWNKGIKAPKISEALRGKFAGSLNPNYGKKQSDYNKEMSRKANLGRKHSKEVNMSKGRNARAVRCTNTGIIFRSYVEAALEYGIKPKVLMQYLSGARTNKTSLIYD